MAILEHINIVVKDIEATTTFLSVAFPQWKVRGQGVSDWYGYQRKWVHIGNDEQYITLNNGNGSQNRDLTGNTTGLAHIGFVVSDVDAITQRLLAHQYKLSTTGADHPNRKTVYFLDPSGFEFEFIEYLSSQPTEKNMYGGETSQVKRYLTPIGSTL